MTIIICTLFGWFLSSSCETLSQQDTSSIKKVGNIEVVEDEQRSKLETNHNSINDVVYKSAPDIFPGMEWLSEDRYDSLEELRGNVVMIDFWTLGCINCQRALPHVVSTYEKYKDVGFVVIGVHAPEFAYERKKENIIGAIEKFNITYPVVLDNDFRIWKNYSNRYWPAQYIIGKDGTIRYTHFGEGSYDEMDRVVNRLTQESYDRI